MNEFKTDVQGTKGIYTIEYRTNSRANYEEAQELIRKFIDNKPQPPKDEPIKYVKLANPKLEHHENLLNGMPNYNIKYNIMAQVNNIADKTIYDAIIKYATEQGITDLFLIDEEFVKSALINELSRIAYENAEKEAKENGYIRVKLDLPKLPRTNFDRITESVEALAGFIENNTSNCYHCFLGIDGKCKSAFKYLGNEICKKEIKEWLQKEEEG